MGRLVIVESPNKVKKLKKYLGDDTEVVATVGHFRDLPDKELGVDLETLTPTYVLMDEKQGVALRLTEAAKRAKEVFLATDADREGEAIAWHVAQVLGLKAPRRMHFREITEAAVKKAAASPTPLDQALVDAQQARRVLDRLVGYQVSPLLRPFGSHHSAGRVQSAALHLVVLREKEREAFRPVAFWPLRVRYGEGFAAFRATQDPKGTWAKTPFASEAEALAALKVAKAAAHDVEALDVTEAERHPKPPFTTSTLQQAASAALGFTPAKTMSTAQALFEKGVITYHRTDSVALSDEAIAMARSLLEQHHPEALAPAPVRYRNNDTAQEAHEAIRPTSPSVESDVTLSVDEEALLGLVSKRFLACQCRPARVAHTTVRTRAGALRFLATGTVVLFPSFLSFLHGDAAPATEAAEEESPELPVLTVAQSLHLTDVTAKGDATKPPARYTQAGLIAAMEKTGIGRPSTYAATLTTLFERTYLGQEQKGVLPLPRGRLIDAVVSVAFPDLVEASYTAAMEAQLDEVAAGRLRWKDAIRAWYGAFARRLAAASSAMAAWYNANREWADSISDAPTRTGKKCPRCASELLLRHGSKGAFLACSAYPACTYSADPSARSSGRVCPLCSGPMEELDGKYGAFARCLTAGCKGRVDAAPVLADACPCCAAPLRDKGAFLGCSKYPVCSFSADKKAWAASKAHPHPCPKCGKPMLERPGRKGRFLGCSGYPACKHVEDVPAPARKARTPSAA